MDRWTRRTWRRGAFLLVGASCLFACTLGPSKRRATELSLEPDEQPYVSDEGAREELVPDNVDYNSGAFGAGERPAGPKKDVDAGPPDAGPVGPDAGPAPRVYCSGALALGDLAIVEIMIASRKGASDPAEWIEVQNTRDCWLKLEGLTISSPRGKSAPNVAIVSAGFELEPRGTFLVAGSANPSLPGRVVAWNASDVLKNDGDALTITSGLTVIDRVEYPALNNLAPGRAFAFPSNCSASDRANWARWSLAFASFGPNLQGTPNSPNDDVTCF